MDFSSPSSLSYSAWALLATAVALLVPLAVLLPPLRPTKVDALRRTHRLAGLRPSQSNLRAQSSPRKHAAQPGRRPWVQSLVVYPVKSCAPVELAESRVLPQGLEFDRLFTFAQLRTPFPFPVDATEEEKAAGDTWHFVTQRQFPLLATVKVDLWLPDARKISRRRRRRRQGPPPGPDGDGDGDGAYVVMRFPWRELGWRGVLQALGAKVAGLSAAAEPEKEVVLPVAFPSEADVAAQGYAYEDVRVWNETVRALDMTPELPRELSLYLGVSNKLGLFRVDPARLREVYRCAPPAEAAGYQPVTGFQDAYPLHLVNMPSVHDFNAKMPKDDELSELDVIRFRPNIIVSGAAPYEEETWKRIRLEASKSEKNKKKENKQAGTGEEAAAAHFHVSCRTVRCRMPNVEPGSGSRHRTQPDRALRELRAVDAGAPRHGCLGMQVTPLPAGAAGGDEGGEGDGRGRRAARGPTGTGDGSEGKSQAEKTGDGEEDDAVSVITVGMDVFVEETGEHVYIPQ